MSFSSVFISSGLRYNISIQFNRVMRSLGTDMRWTALGLSSCIMFGNYYAYDLPASLNTPLQQYLEATDQDYAFHLGLFYSLYSLPNIVLPMFSGVLADTIGIRALLIILSMLVCVGQISFTLGVTYQSYVAMHIGRLLFGMGSESLSVVQSKTTAKWFKGKEIAFALGVNLSVARLGSVFNDVVSPYLAVMGGVPAAMWVGVVTCLCSFWCAIGLADLDGMEVDDVECESSKMEDEMELEAWTDPQLEHPIRSEALMHMDKMDCAGLVQMPLRFWLICLIMCLLYATVIPFNTIHSAFLQKRWYADDPQTASQVMGVPDTISALLVPFVGTLVDQTGHRVKVLIACSVMMMSVHCFFTTANATVYSTPIPALVVLGLAYSMLLTFWPCIPLIVNESNLATAFGIATIALNVTLSVFPIVVARLVNSDPTYYITEVFFTSSCAMGIAACLVLFYIDRQSYNGMLEHQVSPMLSKDSR